MEYSARIVYDENSMKELSRAVSNTFQFGQKAVYVLICLAVLLVGCAVGLQTVTGMVCVACACVLLPSIKVIDRRRASASLRQLGGKTMTVRYVFREDGFRCYNDRETNEFSYSDVIRLVSCKGYLYLFPNRTQAMMIDKSTLKPKDEDGFRDFLTERTGLEWTRPMSVFTIGLRQIRFNRKNTRTV